VKQDDSTPSDTGWFETVVSGRNSLRLVTLFIAASVFFTGIGGLVKTYGLNAPSHGLCMALLSFLSIEALLLFFAFCHACMPGEVTEINARISGRGVMRWLATASNFGCVAVGLYAAWWHHDINVAFLSAGASILCWAVFALIYGIYANHAVSDRVASRRSICGRGTARRALVNMAGLSAGTLVLVGLSGNSVNLLWGNLAAALTMVVLAIVSSVFIRNVDLRDDRG
jgi:hypothetical protein